MFWIGHDRPHRRRAPVLPLLRLHGHDLVPAGHRLRRGLSSESDGREGRSASWCAKYRGTFLLTTPTFCAGYTRKCSPEEFATLRYVLVGAEKLREPVATAFREKFGVDLLEGYGCTEMSPVVAVNAPGSRGAGKSQTGGKPGTVGHPAARRRRATIVDPETCEPLPRERRDCCW